MEDYDETQINLGRGDDLDHRWNAGNCLRARSHNSTH
jgi:hypothetical protein